MKRDKNILRVFLLVIFFIIFVLSLYPVSIYAQTEYSIHLFVKKFESYIDVFQPVGEYGVLVHLFNGTLVYIDVTTGHTSRLNIEGEGIGIIEISGNKAYFVKSNGEIIEVKFPELEILERTYVLNSQDERSIVRAAATWDGRWLALQVEYEYVKDVYLDRLVVYDMSLKKRVFERDANSIDVLVNIFSLDIYENYLVVETINERCEICQYTDNKIEVYNLTNRGVEKIAELVTGWTKKVVYDGYVLAQRIQVNPTGKHDFILLKLPYLDVVKRTETENILGFFMSKRTIYTYTKQKDKFYLKSYDRNLNLQKSTEVLGNRKLGALGQYAVLFSLTGIYVYNSHFKLIKFFYLDVPNVSYRPTSNPRWNEKLVVEKYGEKMLVVLYKRDTYKLQIKVVYRKKPIESASVKIYNLEGESFEEKTGQNGIAVFNLKPGQYFIKISKEGFAELTPIEVLVDKDREVTVELTMKKVLPVHLEIRVFDEENNPISSAEIIFKGNITYSTSTDEGGFATIDIVPGVYNLTVKAENYKYFIKTVHINRTDIPQTLSMSVILQKEKYQLTIKAEGKNAYNITTLYLTDKDGNLLTVIPLGKTVKTVLPRGIYIVKTPENSLCDIKTSIINLNENKTVNIIVACRRPKSQIEVKTPEIISLLKENMIISKNITKSIVFPEFEAPNGTPVNLQEISEGKLLIIEFFYTKCTGCEYLLPLLRELASREDVRVVSITVSPADTEKIIEKYIREHNITWTVLKDTTNFYQTLNITNFPTVVAIKDGKIIFIGIGAKKEIEALEKNATVVSLVKTIKEYIDKIFKIGRPETLIISGAILFILSLAFPEGERNGEKSQDEEDIFDSDNADFHTVHSGDSDIDF
ncbi:MAG: hypothetical protein DRP57_06150 [Spirochaetes bacterium]|nr:MAG: hypothetical protein DRP57_06150 [Spirochaetota bacterium]